MENEISNEYIENAINELNNFFGVKEPVLSENILSSIRGGKVKEAMKLIARQLGLPIDIIIINVPNDYRAQNNDNQFHSTHLSKGHQHEYGSEGEGIIAQVTIPGSLPFYGSSELNGYPINVKISNNCTEHPVVFAMIMAHELSHVLMYLLKYPKKENEFYTDLTAIMQGFQNIFQNGRKITKTDEVNGVKIRTQTTTYGYLNDNQFNIARNKINSILEKNRERKKLLSHNLKNFTKLFLRYEKSLVKFKKFLDFQTKNTNKRITGEDGKKMMAFFQPGYMDIIDSTTIKYKEKQRNIQNFLKDLSHYTNQRNNQLSIYINDLETYTNKLKNTLVPLKKDIKMLKKYVGYKYRIKVFYFILYKRGKKL